MLSLLEVGCLSICFFVVHASLDLYLSADEVFKLFGKNHRPHQKVNVCFNHLKMFCFDWPEQIYYKRGDCGVAHIVF